MKISELILRLQEIVDDSGDCDVLSTDYFWDDESGFMYPVTRAFEDGRFNLQAEGLILEDRA